ncbi:hypothetical protein Esti_003132 [Eimeria stiedai]
MGGKEGGEDVRLSPGEEHVAALKARRPALEKKVSLAGLILLGAGFALTIAGWRLRKGRTAGGSAANTSLQVSVQILQEMGVTPASKLSIGYILAAGIELLRNSLSKASSAINTGTGAQTNATLLMEYGLQAYLGLFAAGGYELLSSAVAAHKYFKTQQQLQENGEEAVASSRAEQAPSQAQNESPQSNQEGRATTSLGGSSEPFDVAQDKAEVAALIAEQLATAATDAGKESSTIHRDN